MILPDDTPESPVKSRAGPPSQAAEEHHLPPPPAYPGHSPYPYPNGGVEAQASSSRTPLVQSQHPSYTQQPAYHVQRAERTTSRFLKAFGVAVLVYVVAISFTRTAIAAAYWRQGSTQRIPFPKSSDGKVIQCSSASSSSFVAGVGIEAMPVTSYLLPLSADVLYVFGRGALTHGNIHVAPTYDPSIPDGLVRVDVTPHADNPVALLFTNICLLERKPGERGVGILTPSSWSPASDLSFTVDVWLPIRGKESLRVKALETNLPLFRHTLVKMEGQVSFGSVKLSSTNAPIDSKYLNADEATIHTSNAKISGNYNVSRSLDLRTSNSAITADVALSNDPAHDAATTLTMNTAGGAINSKVTLHSTAPSHAGGVFSIVSQTHNSPLDLTFDAQPVGSTLRLSARTSNAHATVHLQPAYEGAFELRTAQGSSVFNVDERAADPAARGRTRWWAMTERTMRAFRGWLSWGDPTKGEGAPGRVIVETVNGAVRLTA